MKPGFKLSLMEIEDTNDKEETKEVAPSVGKVRKGFSMMKLEIDE
jgi:hypothetical protein